MTFEVVAPITRANAVPLEFPELGLRKVLVKWQEASFLCNLPHVRVIDDDQIVVIRENLDSTLAEFLQASSFPFNREVRVFFAEMFRGSQQGRQPAIMLPCHSPQSLRLTLHFLRLLRRAKSFRYLHPHIRSL